MFSKKTFEMVLTALFTAIIIIMAFVPYLGYINLVVIKATLIHVPVIIGSIVSDRKRVDFQDSYLDVPVLSTIRLIQVYCRSHFHHFIPQGKSVAISLVLLFVLYHVSQQELFHILYMLELKNCVRKKQPETGLHFRLQALQVHLQIRAGYEFNLYLFQFGVCFGKKYCAGCSLRSDFNDHCDERCAGGDCCSGTYNSNWKSTHKVEEIGFVNR